VTQTIQSSWILCYEWHLSEFFFYLFLFLIALTSYSAELKFADVQNKHANRKHTATKPNETNANKENTSKKQSFAYIQASLKIFKHHG